MSLRTILQPIATSILTSTRTRDARRQIHEAVRFLSGRPRKVLYFHQVDDPYSYLTAQLLEALVDRYDVDFEMHLVGPPPDSAAPDRERLVEYSRKDAGLLAAARGLHFRAPGRQPSVQLVEMATGLLAGVASPRAFAALAPRVGEALWDGDEEALRAMGRDQDAVSDDRVRSSIARGNALRKRSGHYLGAVFHYGGELYWGVDRLGYLEERLVSLGLLKQPAAFPLAPRLETTSQPRDSQDSAGATGTDLTLEFFVSLRSPYSYVAMQRTFELAERTGVVLKIRPVLPMVMRGLAVPAAKRIYITLDTKREADAVGVPFGRICDPVGRPVERAFSLYPFALSKGRVAEYLLAFCRASFAEGVDTGSDAGLRHVVEGAGLSWEEASRSVDVDGWREELDGNRRDMMALGLWGVPSFRLRGPAGTSDFSIWGQDRIWMIEEEIRRRTSA